MCRRGRGYGDYADGAGQLGDVLGVFDLSDFLCDETATKYPCLDGAVCGFEYHRPHLPCGIVLSCVCDVGGHRLACDDIQGHRFGAYQRVITTGEPRSQPLVAHVLVRIARLS